MPLTEVQDFLNGAKKAMFIDMLKSSINYPSDDEPASDKPAAAAESEDVKACFSCVKLGETNLIPKFFENCQRSLYFCGSCYEKPSLRKLKERGYCGLCDSCDYGNNKVNIAVVFVVVV